MRNAYFILSLLLLITSLVQAQNEIKVTGKVVDENGYPLPFTDIANRRKQLGFSSSKDGSFSTTMLLSDSLVFLRKNFNAAKLTLRDSTAKNEYYVVVKMERMAIELSEVQINAIRTHQQIRTEINKLQVVNTDVNPDARPLLNPISYLYELISKKEKEKRVASQLVTEERKRMVLKDLFRLYNAYDIIDLDEDEYDRFITYLNLPYEYLQHTSDYDLAVSIRRMYASYHKDTKSSFGKPIYPAALDDLEKIKHKE